MSAGPKSRRVESLRANTVDVETHLSLKGYTYACRVPDPLYCGLSEDLVMLKPTRLPCGHVLDAASIERVTARQKDYIQAGVGPWFECPIDLCDIPFLSSAVRPATDLQAVVDALPVVCPTGCGLTMPRSTLVGHIVCDCPRALVGCTASACLQPVVRSQVEAHEDSCPFVAAPCADCGTDIERGKLSPGEALKRHRETCPTALITCPTCTAQHTRDRTDVHLEHVCRRQCRFVDYGCARLKLFVGAAQLRSHASKCDWQQGPIGPAVDQLEDELKAIDQPLSPAQRDAVGRALLILDRRYHSLLAAVDGVPVGQALTADASATRMTIDWDDLFTGSALPAAADSSATTSPVVRRRASPRIDLFEPFQMSL